MPRLPWALPILNHAHARRCGCGTSRRRCMPARRCFRATPLTSQHWSATLGPGCPVNVSALTLSAARGRARRRPAALRRRRRGRGRAGPRALPGPLPGDPRHRPRAAGAVGRTSPMRWTTCRHVCWCAATPSAPVDRFDPALPAFAADTVERLAALGVQLVGIDSASVDPADSKPLPSHQVHAPAGPARARKPGARRACPKVTTS
jgi:hypothetical protein